MSSSSFSKPVEDPLARRLGRGLRYLKAAVHIGVNGTQDDGMDGYAIGPARSARKD